jgi:hypothetical protein
MYYFKKKLFEKEPNFLLASWEAIEEKEQCWNFRTICGG